MKQWIKWLLVGLGAAAVLLGGSGGYFLYRLAGIGSAYKAKVLCSGLFVSKRNPQSILNPDLLADHLSTLRHFDADMDPVNRSVTCSLWGLAERTALFRPGLGCTLAIGISEERLRSQIQLPPIPHSPAGHRALWPAGDHIPSLDIASLVQSKKLQRVLDAAFSEPDPDRLRRTRAVVVLHRGRILAERYAGGFSRDTPLPGWSMTKSVMNALVGILVGRRRLSLEDRALLPEWQKADDPRREITLDQLLRMTSGLEFDETYTNPLGDVISMLLATNDTAAYAAHKCLASKPGQKWSYSSGTTNIISRIIRNALVGEGGMDYHAFPRQALFHRIGMRSATLEPDASGTFVGSSFMYATARDWARFGLLYLKDGIWEGERILPRGWVAYTRTPALTAASVPYGAHFWLDIPSYFKSTKRVGPPVPKDAFHAVGHEGQFITIIPSRELVLVRLGLARLRGAWDHASFISRILAAMGE